MEKALSWTELYEVIQRLKGLAVFVVDNDGIQEYPHEWVWNRRFYFPVDDRYVVADGGIYLVKDAGRQRMWAFESAPAPQVVAAGGDNDFPNLSWVLTDDNRLMLTEDVARVRWAFKLFDGMAVTVFQEGHEEAIGMHLRARLYQVADDRVAERRPRQVELPSFKRGVRS